MKSTKRLFVISYSLGITTLVATILSLPAIVFGYSFSLSMIFWIGIQPILRYLYDRYEQINILADYKARMLAKPFREDILPFRCEACGTEHNVPFNLHNTEFRCMKCKRLNGIHITFSTAIVSELV